MAHGKASTPFPVSRSKHMMLKGPHTLISEMSLITGISILNHSDLGSYGLKLSLMFIMK